ncbi:MAG: NAD-dependent epimerase/dehydratase family protein, partial [Phycisphaerales bacterium]|nr:NAD-dependent epimerase/dehydratase family protein [Phycisphaerales bacterium]
MQLVTVLGGYGIFGSRISEALAGGGECRVRVAGRNQIVGANHAHRIGAEFRVCDLADVDALRRAIDGSFIVIHTAGPFQGADYRVAEACLACGAHSLDLADGRAFVAGIGALNDRAVKKERLVVSGVSSAPGITAALIDALRPDFSEIGEIQIALSPGNRNPRGASTVGAVLTYLGKGIRVWRDGRWVERPGWGDAVRLEFPPPVGRRRVHNCDVPDLQLFPAHFGARTVRFHAGLELDALNY